MHTYESITEFKGQWYKLETAMDLCRKTLPCVYIHILFLESLAEMFG